MKYRVEGGIAHIGADMVLKLSPEQAAVRAHALEKVSGGFRPTQIVQFKAGETIDIDVKPDDLPRSLAAVLFAEGKKAPAAKGGKGTRTKAGAPDDPGAGGSGEGGGSGE